MDKKLRAFIPTMAPAELVLSDHFTINTTDTIFGHSRMVTFKFDQADLRPLGHNDTFCCGATVHLRKDRFLMQVGNQHSPFLTVFTEGRYRPHLRSV